MVMARAAFGNKSAWHPYLVSTRRSDTMAHDKATIVSGGPRLSFLWHVSEIRALGYKRTTQVRGKLSCLLQGFRILSTVNAKTAMWLHVMA